MFGRRKDGPAFRVSCGEPRHFLVRVRGTGFRHYEHGEVGFDTTRGLTAPHEEKAAAQALALVPVQLAPYGAPLGGFDLRVEVVVETTLKRILSFAPNGFTFFQGPQP